MGVGYDLVDREALARRGVILCNIPGIAPYTTLITCDHTIQ